MTDFYDGPRGGVADFRGAPHVYASEFDDHSDGYRADFLLGPISEDALALALEDWAIWLRWENAFYAGQTTLDTHPALSEDRARSAELARTLKQVLVMNEALAFRACGEFKPIELAPVGYRGWVPLQVRWERVCATTQHRVGRKPPNE